MLSTSLPFQSFRTTTSSVCCFIIFPFSFFFLSLSSPTREPVPFGERYRVEAHFLPLSGPFGLGSGSAFILSAAAFADADGREGPPSTLGSPRVHLHHV